MLNMLQHLRNYLPLDLMLSMSELLPLFKGKNNISQILIWLFNRRRKIKQIFDLLFGTEVSKTVWNGGCWNAGNVFWLLLKNELFDVCDGGEANENKSSVNNSCWTFDDDFCCWEKKSVPPKPFPLDVVVVGWVNAVGDEESLF